MGKKKNGSDQLELFFSPPSRTFFFCPPRQSIPLGRFRGGRAIQIVAQTKSRVDSERFNHELRWRASGSGVKTWEVRTQSGNWSHNPRCHAQLEAESLERGKVNHGAHARKKNGRPVDTMTTFVENTESALSSGV